MMEISTSHCEMGGWNMAGKDDADDSKDPGPLWDESSARHLVTLLALAGDGDQPDWLAITPEGYATGCDKLVAQARWRVNSQDMIAAPVWTALRQSSMVARAMRGEVVSAPAFDKK